MSAPLLPSCDFCGLGTFNKLDGEMTGSDGTFYQIRSDGSACRVTPDQKTPFAVVTFFEPDKELDLPRGVNKEGLQSLIEAATDANLFTAVKIDGIFAEVDTRGEGAGPCPIRGYSNVQGNRTFGIDHRPSEE